MALLLMSRDFKPVHRQAFGLDPAVAGFDSPITL